MRILVIEDEERLARVIARLLAHERIDVDIASDGPTGLRMAMDGGYDVAIVDRMLPGMNGLSLVRELRRAKFSLPVLMLTALGDMPERVHGLNAGADDYLGKPFAFEELLARVRALQRRAERPAKGEGVQVDCLSIDFVRKHVLVSGQLIELTPQEYRVLEVLAKNRGRIVDRDELLQSAWGPEADPAGNVVDLYIYYLRKKLGGDGSPGASLIQTVRGAGYVLRDSG